MSAVDAALPVDALAAVWTAVAGAVVGSFLNVVVARVPAGESIVHPGSRCPACRSPIRWYDNVPVASWLVLRARCRACGARISPRYPLVEVAGGVLAVAALARHGFGGAAAAEFAFSGALLTLALIDLDTWLLPNAVTWPLIAFGLAAAAAGVSPAGSMRQAAYGAGLGFAAFALVAWLGQKVFRREALGFGDVWLLAALGAWLGPRGLLPVVLLASTQGAAVGIALLVLGKGQPGPAPEPPAPGPAETSSPSEAPAATPAATPAETSTATPAPSSTETPAATTTPTDAAAGDGWMPPKNAVPFGPFLVLGAMEWLWLGGALARVLPALRLFR